MESWRNELYNSLSHAAEGSTWKDHKYVAIIDGKYIYPEDVQGMSSGNSDVDSAKTTYATKNKDKTIRKATNKEGPKQKTYDGKVIKTVDKGSVKNYKDLPEDPIEGDMYFLENTQVQVYWNGKIWTPIVKSEQKKKTATTTTTATTAAPTASSGYYSGGSGRSKKASKSSNSSGSSGLSQATIAKAREAFAKLSSPLGSSGSSGTKKYGNGGR